MMLARPVRSILLLALFLSLGLPIATRHAEAAPPALNCSGANAAITAPQTGSSLNGIVQIEGTAQLGSAFQYYKIEVAPSGTEAYGIIGGLNRQPVTNGQLAVWDSASVPDGAYTLRLRVVDTTGNYCEALMNGLQVQNSNPVTPTLAPTPVETEAPAAFAVVPTAIPTIVIPGGTQGSGLSGPTATPPPSGTVTAPSGTSSLLGGFSTDSITGAVGGLFGGFARAFMFGVLTMAGLILLIGVVMYVRRSL